MADAEALGTYVEGWVASAPPLDDVDVFVRDAMYALVEARMVRYDADGWDLKLHEAHPDAPRTKLKVMIREGDGINTHPDFYDRFALPVVHMAYRRGLLTKNTRPLGYPNAGTSIAAAVVRLSQERLGFNLTQLQQDKIKHDDGRRELGDITSEHRAGEAVLAIDDTATGGDTKLEGWRKIVEHELAYKGLMLIVERDPIATALVAERTNAPVHSPIHWMTLMRLAARNLDLPESVIQHELDYPKRLFEWKLANGMLGDVPGIPAA